MPDSAASKQAELLRLLAGGGAIVVVKGTKRRGFFHLRRSLGFTLGSIAQPDVAQVFVLPALL